MPDTPITSLYVHVPFCAHKCEYCAFYSEASTGELIERYTGALIRELEILAPDLAPQTIFFGGGTPSLLNLRQWTRILEAMHRLNLAGAAEWTVECNPATVSLDKARLLRSHGVNRISMGVQSFDEVLLDRLGRIHSRDMVFRSFDTLRAAGFNNLNIDLMFAIPGQTMEVWRKTLDEALALGSEHLSSYEVIYEEDTPLYAQMQAGQFDVDEDLACAMYEELIARTAAGFQQYEIANFARDRPRSGESRAFSLSPAGGEGEERVRSFNGSGNGNRRPSSLPLPGERADFSSDQSIPHYACHHNINYWRGGYYHAAGPSAAGYVRGIRTKNWSNTQIYCDQLEKGRRAIESSEDLTPLARAGEIAAFGLRMNAGWPFDQFRRVTGRDLRDEWAQEMNRLVQQGWARADEFRFQLTPTGLRFADSAAELFLR